ncbi:hypothetical protein BAC3_01102 [uncultured bacterium]|nr:hypothetical protein BAC3_01102 [uncultured bacterium]
MKFQTQNKPMAMFSFSSLTDIVMLLLIFFLISSQFVIQSGVKVSLPGAKNSDQVLSTRYVITVQKSGDLFLRGERTTMDALPAQFKALKPEMGENTLIISADKDVPLDMVIRVIDAARGAEIIKFTIETQKTDSKERK